MVEYALAAEATGVNTTVLSGALLLALPISVLAGMVSFFSPCVLPLVPGYLSYVTGVSGADLAEARRGRMLAGALLFIAGFTTVFVSTGALFGYFGETLRENNEIISRVLGGLVIVLGLFFMGAIPGLTMREFRFHKKPTAGLIGAPMLGVLFGVGWTPCMGPTLAAVTTLSLDQASARPGRPADRRLLPRTRPAVHPHRDRLPQGARRIRMGEEALCVGDAHRRRHADPDRSAARHRNVGQHRQRHAELDPTLHGGDLRTKRT